MNGTNLTKVAEAKIGKWNQGVVWSRDGKILLAQNMVENSLSVLSFDGKNLKVTDEIKVKGDRRAYGLPSAESKRIGGVRAELMSDPGHQVWVSVSALPPLLGDERKQA